MVTRWLRQRWSALREQREASTLAARAIPDDLWLDTLRQFPFLRWRSTAQLTELRRLSTLFLAHKEFSTLHGFVLTDAMAVAIAAQACMPVIELGLAPYQGFVGIIVSPDEVVAHREWVDDDGVVHSGDETLAGEAMLGGPVLLSWQDVDAAGWTSQDGYNVVVHEFVHVLDMADGHDADGIPPMDDPALHQRWLALMPAALARHQQAVEDMPDPDDDADRAASSSTPPPVTPEPWLDPYGAAGPEEFFAVTAEAFFVAPTSLKAHYPQVYALLRDYFRQDPGHFQH